MEWTQRAILGPLVVGSLDVPVAKDDPEGGSVGELVSDDRPSPEADVIVADRERLAHALVGTLPARERSVIQLRFGLASGREWTLQLIASMTGISRERVRQVERAALRRMRGELPAKEHRALAARWQAPLVEAADRLAAIEDVLERGDLDPAVRRGFVAEVSHLRARLRSAS